MKNHRLNIMAAPLLICSLAALGYAAPGADALWPDLSQPPQAVGGGEKDAAVIVGIENYAFVDGVSGAGQNAQDWQAYLTGTRRVPADKVALLRDNEATLEQMSRFAAEKASQVGPGGTLWFVFIGHGAPSPDGKDGLLVGADAQQTAVSIYSRSLSRAALLKALSQGQQKKTVVLLDACFSGRTTSNKPLVAGLQPLVAINNRPEGIDNKTILLTAAKSDEFAGPLPKAGQARPAFSYLALGALRGWAADVGGEVKASGIVEFAQKALSLEKGRRQTPELAAGDPEAVLSSGREKGPDLAKIDREGDLIGMSSLPSVPKISAPKLPGMADVRQLNFDGIDSETLQQLQKFDETTRSDKDTAVPVQDKIASWTNLAKAAPKYADVAAKRAAEWTAYAEQQKALEEARNARIKARDADWEKLHKILGLSVVPPADKERWVAQFLKAYVESPGLGDGMAVELITYVAPGPKQDMRRKLAKRIEVDDVKATFPASDTALTYAALAAAYARQTAGGTGLAAQPKLTGTWLLVGRAENHADGKYDGANASAEESLVFKIKPAPSGISVKVNTSQTVSGDNCYNQGSDSYSCTIPLPQGEFLVSMNSTSGKSSISFTAKISAHPVDGIKDPMAVSEKYVCYGLTQDKLLCQINGYGKWSGNKNLTEEHASFRTFVKQP